MEKEFHVVHNGYIGSYIEERADNDGDNLRKNLSLNVSDNNVYFINPVTGLLESKLENVDTNNPTIVQYNSTKPTSPTTNLIIKKIGKTLKVVNVPNTEICVNKTISGSNYVYGSQTIPTGSENCEKSIYFTSNNHIQWPQLNQTNAVLSDLSKKIPYDVGFSKKYYSIKKLSEDHLRQIEQDTKISAEFLKKFHTLFLFDTEYEDNIEYSKIKISEEWDGFSVDKNDSNNLVYSDYYKTQSSSYAPYVFLVTDNVLNQLNDYFLEISNDKGTLFDSTKVFNPDIWINEKNKKQSLYGTQLSFKKINSGSINEINPKEEQILDILSKKEIYKINPLVTDLDLVEDVVATEIFFEIVDGSSLFVMNSSDVGVTQINISNEQTSLIETNLNKLNKLFIKYDDLINNQKYEINKKVYKLIKKYFNFQLNNNFPIREKIKFETDKFNTIFHDYAFYATDENIAITGFESLSVNIFDIQYNSINQEYTVILLNQSQTENNQIIPPIIASTAISVNNNNIVPIYKKIDLSQDYAESDTFYITKPLFSNQLDGYNEFHTGSTSVNHTNYYTPIYTKNINNVDSKYVFDIAYAHISGSGSSYVNGGFDYLPAKSIYKKYVNECLGNYDIMTFKNNKRSDYFYVLHFNRDAFKDRLDSQNLQITLSPLSSSIDQSINTGSNFNVDTNSSTIYTLIDDSKNMKVYSSSMIGLEEYYNLVEGTIQDGAKYDTESNAWGMIFPRKGIILLDGIVLDQSCSFNTVTSSIDGDNIRKLFLSISGSCSPNNVRTTYGKWYIRSAELYSDQNYFCRVGRNEFNYTNNYTYVSGSNRKFFYDKVNDSTKTYISTIGLYNDNKELLAVAKLAKPFLKDSSLEYVFNIKLKSN